MSSNTGGDDNQEFPLQYQYVLLSLSAVIMLYLILHFFRLRQRRVTQKRMTKSAALRESENYSLDVVQNLMPFLDIQKHRFRGLAPVSTPVDLDFQDLGLKLKDGTQVLRGVTGSFPSGAMAAIMGPSGAGKTTFMNVLTGKAHYGIATGTIYMNGEETIASELRKYRGFVPQDDIVHDSLTVREQIYYAAKLRSPIGTSESRLFFIVEDVINVLQLALVQDSIVGSIETKGISGGQRKRVNIGLELAMSPSVLFMDEPTSGLDSTSALAIMSSMKAMTQLGLNIIMVCHQPRYSLFTLFDDVLLLGVGGHTVYLGPSTGVKPYLEELGYRMAENENPADWFMDVLAGEEPNAINPHMKVQQLFEHWQRCGPAEVRAWVEQNTPEHSRRVQGRGSEGGFLHDVVASPPDVPLRGLGSRMWTDRDHSQVLASALRECFDQADKNRTRSLTRAELEEVLRLCTGRSPSTSVTEEVFASMGGVNGIVGRLQFMEFFMSIKDTIMLDARAAPDAACSSSTSEDSSSGPSSSDECCRNTLRSHFNNGPEYRPGPLHQFPVLLHRTLVSWTRQRRDRILSIGLMIFTAMLFGSFGKGLLDVKSMTMAAKLNVAHVNLSILLAIHSTNIFKNDKPLFWRESGSGISVLAFYSSRVVVSFIDMVALAMLYTTTWYCSIHPDGEFAIYLGPLMASAFISNAIGILVSVIAPQQVCTLATGVVVTTLGVALGDPENITRAADSAASMVMKFSYVTWTVGLSFLVDIDRHGGMNAVPAIFQGVPKAYQKLIVTSDDYVVISLLVLASMAVALYILGYFGLACLHRSKQM